MDKYRLDSINIAADTSQSETPALLVELLSFISDEQSAGNQKLLDVWQRPLIEKLEKGWTQGFFRMERGEEPQTIWAYPDDSESRFREGDLLFLHGGSPLDNPVCHQLLFEREEDERWLLRGNRAVTVWDEYTGGVIYADPDAIDLTKYYERAITDIATSEIGRRVIQPLLSDELEITFDERDVNEGERVAIRYGCNANQAKAVGMAYGAEQIACIQGPPGTGKTLVLSLIAQLMVSRGERILMTSHTHMAINNALNKIFSQGVPTVKVGQETQRKGLNSQIRCVSGLDGWEERPRTGGYVVGATPFATCNSRLENYEFDTILFDEASQITVPLALMAMRKGKKFIFIGDQKQLPPVLLSKSVLAKETFSIFGKLTDQTAEHTVMLNETFRMNRWLSDWPSQTYYAQKLYSVGVNRERFLALPSLDVRWAEVFDPAACSIFISTQDRSARTRNYRDAELVAELCEVAHSGGLPLSSIGIVSPYRAHGRAIRRLLSMRFGRSEARTVIADTVERMQGQERELIILSLATGDEVFLAAIGEFFFQPERLNVAITRAMTKLIVIGPDIAELSNIEDEKVNLWVEQYRNLIRHCRRVNIPA